MHSRPFKLFGSSLSCCVWTVRSSHCQSSKVHESYSNSLSSHRGAERCPAVGKLDAGDESEAIDHLGEGRHSHKQLVPAQGRRRCNKSWQPVPLEAGMGRLKKCDSSTVFLGLCSVPRPVPQQKQKPAMPADRDQMGLHGPLYRQPAPGRPTHVNSGKRSRGCVSNLGSTEASPLARMPNGPMNKVW